MGFRESLKLMFWPDTGASSEEKPEEALSKEQLAALKSADKMAEGIENGRVNNGKKGGFVPKAGDVKNHPTDKSRQDRDSEMSRE
jgi:hypothetical protein